MKSGEIFGEIAALGNLPRSASAVAQTPCRVIALDQRQFRKALAQKPAFALMLMKVMMARLREAVARLKRKDLTPGEEPPREPPVFNPKLLADMVRGLCDDAPVSFLRNQVILEEGQVGTRMYAVLEGASPSRSAARWSTASAPEACSASSPCSISRRGSRAPSPRTMSRCSPSTAMPSSPS